MLFERSSYLSNNFFIVSTNSCKVILFHFVTQNELIYRMINYLLIEYFIEVYDLINFFMNRYNNPLHQ